VRELGLDHAAAQAQRGEVRLVTESLGELGGGRDDRLGIGKLGGGREDRLGIEIWDRSLLRRFSRGSPGNVFVIPTRRRS
jgi:hypothetical protein